MTSACPCLAADDQKRPRLGSEAHPFRREGPDVVEILPARPRRVADLNQRVRNRRHVLSCQRAVGTRSRYPVRNHRGPLRRPDWTDGRASLPVVCAGMAANLWEPEPSGLVRSCLELRVQHWSGLADWAFGRQDEGTAKTCPCPCLSCTPNSHLPWLAVGSGGTWVLPAESAHQTRGRAAVHRGRAVLSSRGDGCGRSAMGSSLDQGATSPWSWNRSTWDRPTRNPAALMRATVSR
jgi:hypothetical protein